MTSILAYFLNSRIGSSEVDLGEFVSLKLSNMFVEVKRLWSTLFAFELGFQQLDHSKEHPSLLNLFGFIVRGC